jgi:hypothetical protein
VRNRVRRRLRAISREAGPLLHSGAYLLGVSAKATSMSYQQLRDTVFEALAALPGPGPGATSGAAVPSAALPASPASPTSCAPR